MTKPDAVMLDAGDCRPHNADGSRKQVIESCGVGTSKRQAEKLDRNSTSRISDILTPRQRLSEVASILAAGYLRSRGIVDLTSLPDESVHVVEPVRRRR